MAATVRSCVFVCVVGHVCLCLLNHNVLVITVKRHNWENVKTFKWFSQFFSLYFHSLSFSVYQSSMRMIHVSVDQGDVWDMAQLPDVGHEQFYSILSANDDMVFMHVDEPGGQFCVFAHVHLHVVLKLVRLNHVIKVLIVLVFLIHHSDNITLLTLCIV